MKNIALACLLLLLVTAASDPPGYDREEVRFFSGRFELVGDLLTPQDGKSHPAIIYVWGAGPTNRNAHIDTSPILKAFLAHGFAVLLYDKPGSGQSTGKFDNNHLLAERASILTDAITFLRKRPGIDPDAIGFYGSSQASYVMAVVLAQASDVAFVIAWFVPMENSVRQSAYLVGNYVLCDGGSTEEAETAKRAYIKRASARTYTEYRAAAEILDGIPAIRDGLWWAGVVSEKEWTPNDATSESFFDPSQAMAALKIPVLALFAENDRQIDPTQGAAAYRRLLAGGPESLSKVVVIPGADHNMNLSPRGCMQDQKDGYRAVGGKTLSPVFVETVTAWLDPLKGYLEKQ